jgi:hypothetical protein
MQRYKTFFIYIHDQVIQFNIKTLKTNKAIEIFGENIQKWEHLNKLLFVGKIKRRQKKIFH